MVESPHQSSDHDRDGHEELALVTLDGLDAGDAADFARSHDTETPEYCGHLILGREVLPSLTAYWGWVRGVSFPHPWAAMRTFPFFPSS